MVEPLTAGGGIDSALSAALPAPGPTLSVRLAGEMRVLALRHLPSGRPGALPGALPGGTGAVEAALAAHLADPLPTPGRVCGADPWVVWVGPGEWLGVTTRTAVADELMQTLAPGRAALACGLDQSSGRVVFDLSGPGLAALLPRLFDASAIAHHAGQGSRARLMDISAVLMRLAPERALILVDRSEGVYAAQWIRHALDAEVSGP